MNKNRLARADIDYDRGVARFMGKAERYESFLVNFANDGCIARARAALDAGDYQAMLLSVHELKGLSGNLEIKGVYWAASELTALLRGERYSGVPEGLRALEQAYRQALEGIEDAREERSDGNGTTKEADARR